MANIVAVSSSRHRGKSWKRFESYAFSASLNLAPLVAAELAGAVHAMPLAFVPGDNRYVLVGVLSLSPGHNLFVADDGRWLGGYVPACFRGHPFRLAKIEGKDDMVLCVDEDSGLISDGAGEPFFEEKDRLSQAVANVLEFLKKVEQSRAMTDLALSALSDAGLIVPWSLKTRAGENERVVSGLYKVDEAKLNSLDAPTFLKIRQALPIAYAQLLSMTNIGMFEKLANLRRRTVVPDLGRLSGDDDILRFS